MVRTYTNLPVRTNAWALKVQNIYIPFNSLLSESPGLHSGFYRTRSPAYLLLFVDSTTLTTSAMFGKLAPVVAFLAFTMQPVLSAAVASRAAQDVFVPPVTYPTAGTVWTLGETQNVTWYVVQVRSSSAEEARPGLHVFHSSNSILIFVCARRDVSNAPQNITNNKGMIILRKGGLSTPRESPSPLPLLRVRQHVANICGVLPTICIRCSLPPQSSSRTASTSVSGRSRSPSRGSWRAPTTPSSVRTCERSSVSHLFLCSCAFAT